MYEAAKNVDKCCLGTDSPDFRLSDRAQRHCAAREVRASCRDHLQHGRSCELLVLHLLRATAALPMTQAASSRGLVTNLSYS